MIPEAERCQPDVLQPGRRASGTQLARGHAQGQGHVPGQDSL